MCARRCAPLAVLLVVAATPRLAHAQLNVEVSRDPRAPDAAARSAARAHFDRGVALAQQARWDAAAREFVAARALAPTPAVHYNLALAERAAGRPRAGLDAALAYRDALGAGAPPAARAEAAALVDRMRAELARLVPVLDPSDAVLRVDGAAVRTDARGVEVDPGRHTVEAAAAGYRAQRRTLFVAAGARATVEFHLVREERSARLIVETNAREAAVRIDGHDVDAGRADEYVSPGAHVVEVRAAGRATARRSVTLALGETRTLRVQMDPSPRVAESPWLWLGVAVVVVAGVATGVGLAAAIEPPAPTAWGHVGDAITVRW